MKAFVQRLRFIVWLPVLLIVAACGGSTAGLSVGNSAPGFTLSSATGEQVSLAGYAGQPVLLYFHMAVG